MLMHEWAEEMAQCLRALVAFAEDLDWIPTLWLTTIHNVKQSHNHICGAHS